MVEQVEVKICVGTLCSVMGGSELQLLEEYVPEAWRGHVRIVGSTCLEACRNQEQSGNPPYATVDGQLCPGATIGTLLEAIGRRLQALGIPVEGEA